MEEVFAPNGNQGPLFRTIDKLKRLYIPDFVKLKIPNPYKNMAEPLKGSMAINPSMFKVGIRLT